MELMWFVRVGLHSQVITLQSIITIKNTIELSGTLCENSLGTVTTTTSFCLNNPCLNNGICSSVSKICVCPSKKNYE